MKLLKHRSLNLYRKEVILEQRFLMRTAMYISNIIRICVPLLVIVTIGSVVCVIKYKDYILGLFAIYEIIGYILMHVVTKNFIKKHIKVR
jgi:hypothetical protein